MRADEIKFHETLAACCRVVTSHLPGPAARLDLESRLYANSVYDDLRMVFELLQQGARVLDLGCGKGCISVLLDEAGYDVVGIDLSRTLGEQLEIHSAQWQRPMWQEFQSRWDVRYGYYDGTAIPLAAGSLDAVVAYAVLEHVDPAAREQLLRDVVRVLRPGGRLFVFKCPRRWALTEYLAAVVGLPHHDTLVSARELRSWLEAAGLIVSRVERTDLLPAFPPPILRGCWDRLASLLGGLGSVLRYTPWVLLAHHTRIVAQKSVEAEGDR